MIETPELFEGLGVSERRKILSGACARDFACREMIFWAGEPIKEIFLLTKGRVKITQLSMDGREIILGLTVPGEVIGLQGLATEDVYSSTAQALQPCRTLVWSRAKFEAVMGRFPLVYGNAQKILARQMEALSRRICDIVIGKVSWRLASGLLHLFRKIGRKVDGQFALDVTQEIVAGMTGMTVSTANRQLSKWEGQGLVKCLRNCIVIRDFSALTQICQDGQSVSAEVVFARDCPSFDRQNQLMPAAAESLNRT